MSRVRRFVESADQRPQARTDGSIAPGAAGQRLSNLQKLYHVPVFAVREMLKKRVPGRGFGDLRQAELVAEAEKELAVTEADIEDLYENYRYGRRLSFYLYLLPSGLTKPKPDEFQRVLDELAVQDRPSLDDEIAASEDYESETSPHQVVLLDEEKLDGIWEIRYRYHTIHRFLNSEEQPDQVLQVRYGFLWLDLDLGYLVILSRDEWVNHLLIRALSNCMQAIPLPVRLSKELIDKHFSIEKIRRVSHYDPGTGVRQSLSGHGLWQVFEKEILARERRYTRPSSLYEEEVARGVVSGLGVTSSKGKIYLTRTLSTSMVRTWGLQRLPDLVRDLKDLRADRPSYFSRSLETINRMRLPSEGRAAVIDIAESLLETEREDLTSVDLHQTASEIYQALAGKYFNPYLRTQCAKCDETAELCPHCESQELDFGEQRVTCTECGALISDEESITLRCMNGHVTTVSHADGFSIAPNHWFQKRLARIFAEMGYLWSEQADYFHIEGSTLYRLRKGDVERNQLPEVVQNYISNFWEPVSGQIHAGRGDIVTGRARPQSDAKGVPGEKQPERSPGEGMLQTYESFDVRLGGDLTAGYTVEAAVSSGGSVSPQPFALPQDGSFRRQLDDVLRQTADDNDIQAVAEILYNALFPAPILKLWARSLGKLEDNVGLRLRLHIDPAELMVLPWELLLEEEYVGLGLRFPLARYLDLPDPPQPLAVRPPFRLLVAVSQPQDRQTFDADTELTNIRRALRPLSGYVEMEVVDHITREELLARLRHDYQLLHYIGPSTFEGNEGYLILEDPTGQSDPISALMLGQMIADSSLRLVTLNACEVSPAGTGDVAHDIACRLVEGGVPAVVAVRSVIADHGAIAFGRGFYGALASGWPVDAAVQAGRRGIVADLGKDWNKHVDWAIPALYMRAPDGVIFGIMEEIGGMGDKKKERASKITQNVQYHGPVYGPAHAGSGDINVDTLQYGLDAEDLAGLFEALRQQVEEQAPPEAKEAALEQVEALEQAVEEDEPDVSMMESVLNWFKKHLPQLAGTVTSVLLNPLVGRVVEAAGDLVVEEFNRRFGKPEAAS